MIGAFIAGFIVGVVLMALAIKKGYIALKVKKRRKLKLPKDLEIGLKKTSLKIMKKIKKGERL